MSATEASTILSGVDHVSGSTCDGDPAVAFCRETLGLRMPDRCVAGSQTAAGTWA